MQAGGRNAAALLIFACASPIGRIPPPPPARDGDREGSPQQQPLLLLLLPATQKPRRLRLTASSAPCTTDIGAACGQADAPL